MSAHYPGRPEWLDPEYLGDSVYVARTSPFTKMEGCDLVLFTDNGLGPTQEIYLERYTLQALFSYTIRIKEVG